MSFENYVYITLFWCNRDNNKLMGQQDWILVPGVTLWLGANRHFYRCPRLKNNTQSKIKGFYGASQSQYSEILQGSFKKYINLVQLLKN